MLAVRLPELLDHRLSDLANETNRSKSYYVKKALEDFLDLFQLTVIKLPLASQV